MKIKTFPDFSLEKESGFRLVAGCDEAGRGPLCGPVVAAAVIFRSKSEERRAQVDDNDSELISSNSPALCALRSSTLINDSKKMTAAARDAAYEFLTTNPDIIWAVGSCSPTEIDELNILHASMRAMRRAIDALSIRPEFVLVDGNRLPPGINGVGACCARPGAGTAPLQDCILGKPIVKGDSKSMSIAAASIIAKVTRDRIMRELGREFPEYCWDKNAGYPTPAHLQAIEKYGINEHYRKTFGPVKKIIAKS